MTKVSPHIHTPSNTGCTAQATHLAGSEDQAGGSGELFVRGGHHAQEYYSGAEPEEASLPLKGCSSGWRAGGGRPLQKLEPPQPVQRPGLLCSLRRKSQLPVSPPRLLLISCAARGTQAGEPPPPAPSQGSPAGVRTRACASTGVRASLPKPLAVGRRLCL